MLGGTVSEATIKLPFTTVVLSTRIPTLVVALPVKAAVGEITTRAPGRKLLPCRATRIPALPREIIPGATLSRVGAKPPAPPPMVRKTVLEAGQVKQFLTWTVWTPETANSLAPRLNVSCVAEMGTVVPSSTPSNNTNELVLNPVPKTVRLSELRPAGTDDGLSNVIVWPCAGLCAATRQMVRAVPASHRDLKNLR